MEQHEDVGNIYDLAKRRLEVAEEDLETAMQNLKEKHLRAANNRAYYCIYHSITAVFALKRKAFKRHKDTIGNFNKDYVKTEIFSRDLGKRIAKAQFVRHNCDYDEFYLVSKEETEEQIATAEELLEEVKKFVMATIEEYKDLKLHCPLGIRTEEELWAHIEHSVAQADAGLGEDADDVVAELLAEIDDEDSGGG